MLKHKTRLAAVGATVAIVAGSLASAGTAIAAPDSVATAVAKAPFIVGFANSTSGPNVFPGMDDAAQAAVQYINRTGGINGHPLQIVPCGVDNGPEKNQACGQQFANNPAIRMVVTGYGLSFGPLYAALAQVAMPTLESVALYPADYAAPNAVTYLGGGIVPAVGNAELANASKARTVAFLQADGPSAGSTINYFNARFNGPDATSVVFPTGTADAIPYLTKAGALTADITVLQMAGCLPFVKAAAQLAIPHTKILSISSCLSAANVAANPVNFEGYRAPYYVWDPLFGFGQNKDLDTFMTEYPKYAKIPTTPIATLSAQAWSAFLSLRAALKGAPDTTLNNKKALFAKLYGFRGPVNMGAPTIKCGSLKQVGPAMCTLWSVKGQVVGGKLRKVAG